MDCTGENLEAAQEEEKILRPCTERVGLITSLSCIFIVEGKKTN
jgi:hypothetical protein